MTREQIVSKATVLASKIRTNRVRLQKDAGALALFNNMINETIILLRETKKFLDRGNTEIATRLITEAEKEYHL